MRLEKVLLLPKEPPPDPVSEICGKNAAFATPISAFAATRFCSASRISGRRSMMEEGRPGGTSGGSVCADQGKPARHTLRIIAKQDADGVFLLSDLPFQIRNGGIRRIEYLLCLEHIEFCGHTVAQPQIGELDRIYLCLHRIARDLELQVELQQREVVGGHITHQGQYDGLPRGFRSQQLGS